MAVTIELPGELEHRLRGTHPDLERQLLESFAADGYRRGELSSLEVGRILGITSRAATTAFLSERGVFPDYDVEELKQDLREVKEMQARPAAS